MTQLKKNIAANIIGQGWGALLQLAFVPLYLKFLGIEAYGLIGFYTMMQAILQILDLGLSPTMTRELARLNTKDGKGKEMRDFVRTLELGYWIIGVAILGVVFGASSFVAHHWIKESLIPIRTVQNAIVLMGVISFFQWPVSFYQGGLMGLQQQVRFNAIKMTMGTFSSVGAVLVLWLVSPTILAFLTWQVLSSSLQIALLALALWLSLPEREHVPEIRKSLLRNISSFAAGMSALSITAIVLTQTDKIILSRLLSLANFGYYTLAGVVAGGLGMITGPMFNALFPQFTALATSGYEERLRTLYHRGTQTMSVLIIPPAVVVVCFSFEVIFAWTGNAVTAANTSTILAFLIAGTALNGLMNLPYVLQLSYGWTSLGLSINACFIATMIPLLYVAATYFGSPGAAAVWLILNVVYFFVGVPLTHRRLLRGETWTWYKNDVFWPLMVAIATTVAAKLIYPGALSRIETALSLAAILITVYVVTALASKDVREWALSRF